MLGCLIIASDAVVYTGRRQDFKVKPLDRSQSHVSVHPQVGILMLAITFIQDSYRVVICRLAHMRVRAVFLIDRSGRVVNQGRTIDIGIETGTISSDMIVTLVAVHTGIDLQHVVEHPVGDFYTRVQDACIAFFHYTLQTAILETGHIVRILSASFQADIVDLAHRCACHLVKPVRRRPVIPDCRNSLSHQCPVFIRIQERKGLGNLLGGHIRIEVHLGGSIEFSFLRSDKNDTVRTPCTVNGCCRTILQHIYLLDIRRRHSVQVSRNAVYEHQRTGGRSQCSDTAQ